jgi:hypothetical protein
LNGEYIKGVMLIFLEVLVNVQGNFNKVIILSFHGDIEKAIIQADYQWLMFYPCYILMRCGMRLKVQEEASTNILQLLNKTTLLFYFRGAYPLSEIAPHCERLKIDFAFFMRAPASVQLFVDQKHFVKTDSVHLHCKGANDA